MSFMPESELLSLFDDDMDGVDALINGAIAVRGVLDEQYVDPLGMSSASPAFTCARTEEYPGLPGDVLDIGTRRWIVTVVEPDGQGLQLLKLRVVS